MLLQRIVKATVVVSAAGIIALLVMDSHVTKVRADPSDSDENLAAIGISIAPSFINMSGKDPILVGLGSFIVNAQADCNGCHGSDPANEFLPTNNPYWLGTNSPPLLNQNYYLNGGQNFGPVGPGFVSDPSSPLFAGPGVGPNIITRNLTPDYTGNPAGGMDLPSFMTVMRTGHDFDMLHLNCGTTNPSTGQLVTDNCYNPPVNGALLQVMPWSRFQYMTDYQLTAIWTYLSAVPCNNDTTGTGTAAPGLIYPWLVNACTAPGKTPPPPSIPTYLSASCGGASFSYGGNYTCNVSVGSTNGIPAGSISYAFDGGTAVNLPLTKGAAQFIWTGPPAGTHSVVISYAAQGAYLGSGPSTQYFTVAQAITQLSLKPSNYYPAALSSFTLSASVSSSSAGAPNSGIVTFMDNGTAIGTGPVNATGQASLTIGSIAAGTHSFVAQFGSQPNFAGSTSNYLTIAAR
jgi:hypothetical protein